MELHSPRRPDLAALRVLACESEIARYVARFPRLSRDRILEVIKSAGPLRRDVEAELERLAAPASRSGDN